ncbi:MAG: phosphate ABC transporter permease PstA [Victivallales bacterium]|nr:phosphate ABC transporter permease PstA [Victivallales bacterium]
MDLRTRKLLDKSFSALGVIAILFMALFLVVILAPIIAKGSGAFIFRGTVEYRKLMFDIWNRGDEKALAEEMQIVAKARKPVYEMMDDFRRELAAMPSSERRKYRRALNDVEKNIENLLGPNPDDREPVLMRQRYGQTRWDMARKHLKDVLYATEWDYSGGMGVKVYVPRQDFFTGTSIEELFPYIEENIDAMMAPRLTLYLRFLTDDSRDSHFFGGIWPELLGTIYLTLGAMLFAVPMGVIAAIYFCEYAKQGLVISYLRICITTLAGVPSIVFGLFGLAFFLNTIRVSESKSVLAGSLTLALLILPTIIRASEEAIMAVPSTYKEAALSLGAGKWRTVMTVILPAALPGILTGIVISMGRAAGETAPIIFTAAVSVGKALNLDEVFTNPSPALPWNIYNLCTEHEAVDQIRHVQFGMVFSLIAVVLFLNITAIVVRARVQKNLRN